ncbi:MAG: hypothetical protein COV45_05895 [Deltaproteobacteria bacterium CG11_big_fil_rev_8_21_14_0_20_47_16]|nr:MAG: hypothetical protein COV45_05895 [Deltaproteobacteria bacterium CG11_big_fil_rev_8_21_14_0_20_47_16]
MARIKICKETGCHNAQTTSGYCRLHYLKHWKELKAAAAEKAAKRLNNYVTYMSKKNPDRYIDDIRRDLRQKHFNANAGQDDETVAGEPDIVDRLFGTDEKEELDEILRDLKIEKDF